MIRFDVVTIFPGYLQPLRESLLGKAIEAGIVEVGIHDLRRFTTDVHQSVDDAPYGGGAGMVMKAEVWGRALDALSEDGGPATLVVPTPAGEPFTQAIAAQLAGLPRVLFACGRYEGIDQRVMVDAATRMPVREISIGDYVLAGGEAAVLVMIEAIARLLPGVLGNPESAVDDSFGAGLPGLLESPSYTRPMSWRGLQVPADLLSGDHARIARFRRDESLRRTVARRPELLAAVPQELFDAGDYDVLRELGAVLPDGLAERIEAERAALAAKRSRRRR